MVLNSVTGRFKHLSKERLEEKLHEQKRVLRALGALGPDELGWPVDPDAPLWVLVEFYENVIRFELENNPLLEIC